MPKRSATMIPQLILDLESSDKEKRQFAVDELSEFGRKAKAAVKPLTEALYDPVPSVAFGAFRALVEIGPNASEAVPIIADWLANDTAMKKGRFNTGDGECLSCFGPGSVRYLSDFALNKTGKIQQWSIEALGRLGADAAPAVSTLIKLLKARSDKIRLLAATALWNLGSVAKEAVGSLLKAVKDPITAPIAICALCAIGPDAAEAVPTVGEWMGNPENEATCPSHVDYPGCLGNLGPEAVPWLVKLVQTRSDNFCASAISALGSLGPAASSAIPVLIKVLETGQRLVLFRTLRALTEMGADVKTMIPNLLNLLSFDDKDVRREVLRTIAAFGAEATSAVPSLLPLLESPDWFRLYAAETLGNIGPTAQAALPGLRKLRDAKEKQVREAADLAISRIDSTPMSAELQEKLAPASDENTIDLARTKPAVVKMLAEGVAKFAAEHPDVQVSCVGLCAHAYGADVYLCFQTPENDSEAQIARLLKEGRLEDYHECSVYNFTYSVYVSEHFPWWPNLYELTGPLKIKLPNGKTVRPNTEDGGDKALNKPIFTMLKEVLREAWPIQGLNRAKLFRVAADTTDGSYREYWTPKTRSSK